MAITEVSKEYELIDSGEGEKLERYGNVTIARPDPQALWPRLLSKDIWQKALCTFRPGEGGKSGVWKIKVGVPKYWKIRFADIDLTFKIVLSPFKHVGIFPEHHSNWKWMVKKVSEAETPIKALNLFGYTGGATLALLRAGAEVVHVDGSKAAVAWARENAELSKLSDKQVRWIVDDAKKFVDREVRRGNKYDVIVMDPPAFGHGAKGEVWKIEEDLLPLIDSAIKLLSERPLFFIINGYSAGYSALAYENNLKPLLKKFGGTIGCGEIAIRESGEDGRLLPCGIFARWYT